MQLQSTILLLGTLLAIASAHPPKNYPSHPSLPAPIEDAQAQIRTYKAPGCPSVGSVQDLKDSPTNIIVQNICFTVPPFFSYKLWQPIRVSEYATCTFSVYGENDCQGEAVAPVNLPATEEEATCADGMVAIGEGSKSYRFSCECLGPLCEAAYEKHGEHGYNKGGH